MFFFSKLKLIDLFYQPLSLLVIKEFIFAFLPKTSLDGANLIQYLEIFSQSSIEIALI